MTAFTPPELELFIDGTWRTGASGRFFDVVNPSNGRVIGKLPLADRDDIERAITAASSSFATWKDVAPAARTRVLLRAVALIRERADELAWLTTLEEGMRLDDAAQLVQRAADILEWDANEGRRLYGRVIPSEAHVRQTVIREPLGPVAAFSPWNGSIFTPCRKIGSALAAGCTLILKAAEETPLSAIALVHIFEEAGVPPGVVNLVFGEPAEISSHLIASPAIRLVSFTGSVRIGKHLAQLAAAQMKPVIMELGGHAPVIVCADADLETAAARLVEVKYFNAGQVCIAPSRVFVDARICAPFTDLIVKIVKRLQVGDGCEPGVGMGPLANPNRLKAVEQLVHEAVQCGATLLCGGHRCERPGLFYEPTVLTDVPAQASILHEEPFGPVLTIAPFADLGDALKQANSLPFGLAGYAFTRSAATADEISRSLECGAVGINHFAVSTHGIPVGGIKDSGYGREGGTEGIAGYTFAKTISHAMV